METYLNNKYYQDLDAYNKELVPHKLAFFKDYQGLDLFLFLDKLSFNTDFNSSNYRWGQRYFNEDIKDFIWITSKNKKITKNLWDNKSRHFNPTECNAYFTEKMINDHFYSCFKPNRKIKFYNKLPQWEKAELSNHLIALINMYKASNNIYGSTQKLGTNILLVDIDNYEERSAIETLGLFLDYINIDVTDLLYLEQNAFTGGIHTALILPKEVNDINFYSNFMKHINDQDIRIECNFVNNILRFPLSYDYVALKKDNRIFDFDEFVPQMFWEKTFETYLDNMNWEPIKSEIIDNFLSIKEETKIEENPIKKYWNTPRKIIQRESTFTYKRKPLNFYKIYKGQRYDTMSKLVPYCKLHGYSLEETAEIIKEQNISSKDLNKWSHSKLINNISKFYNNCPEQLYMSKKSNVFVSNLDKLPNNVKEFLNSKEFRTLITNRFITNYLNLRKKDGIKKISKTKRDILSVIIPESVKEIIGKMYYDINHEKRFIDGIDEELAFQLPDNYLKAIQDSIIEKMNIVSPIAKTSLQYFKKAIILSLSLKEIKYHSRNRNWMKGSCKSFTIRNEQDIIQLISKLYNNLFYRYYNLNKENKLALLLLILYILPDVNPSVLEDRDKIPIRKDFP